MILALWCWLERVAAAILILALLPLLIPVAVLIWLRSGRGPLVTHRRCGQFGTQFGMLKFRTMWGQATPVQEEPPGGKPQEDPRVVGALARFLRRYSVDELPQLLHVITGRMSLVGPRPLTQFEFETHYGDDAEEVLRMRPGLTGLWQVLGRSRLTYRQRRRLDLFLVRRDSFRLRWWILMRTVGQVVTGEDAW